MGSIIFILSVLNIAFLTALTVIFLPFFKALGFSFLILVFGTLFVFGVLLFIFTSVNKIKNPLRRYLNLTGASAVSIFLGSIIHNLFYALEVFLASNPYSSAVASAISAGFFIIAVFAAPILFIYSSFKSITEIIKRKK